MSATDNKAIYRRYIDLLWSPELLDEVLAPNFVAHDLPPGLPSPSREGLKAFRRILAQAFPDLKPTIRTVVAEDDKVAARISLEGHHQGMFMGVPATGKLATVELMEIVRIEAGKIAERWVVRDMYAALVQIGAVPPPPAR